MKRSTKKLISILCVAFFILSIAVPAFAASKNRVVGLLEVEDGHSFYEDTAPYLRIQEEGDDFGTTSSSIEFELRLENAKWLKSATGKIDVDGVEKNVFKETTPAAFWGDFPGYIDGVAVTDAKFYGDKILSLTIEKDNPKDVIIKIPLITKVDGEGDVKVKVVPQKGRVTAGSYVFAVSGKGETITSLIGKVAKFYRERDLATIRVEETRAGALGNEKQNIKLKLPPKFSWDIVDKTGNEVDAYVTFSSALGTVTGKAIKADGRELELKFQPGANRDGCGSIFLDNLKIVADRNAPFGDVVVDVDGSNVTAAELVVAKRLDYDVEISVKEVKELVAGREDEKTAEIKIKENFGGALISNREIDVVLPKWVKIVDAESVGVYDDNELYIKANKGEFKFKLTLSIEADKSGDIVAEFSGAGVEKQEVVIAKAVAPITAEVAAADLKIGVQNQAAPDITITETKKGTIDGDELKITLPKGIKFASTPEAEVTEGNLEIEKPKLGENDDELEIGIKSTSTKPSTIKISDIKLTLDRTVPEGEFKAAIGGNAIVKNDESFKPTNNDDIDFTFKTDNVVKFVFANVVTPAPGETRATSVFTIGSTTYTVIEQNESVEKTMDVAPYIKDGRTFLPLRYVANALGVNDDNIIWDPVTKAVTVFKGDRIAQVTIGSKTMLVNGVTINMDVAPEITDGRTMLPIRWLGQALGSTIDWDAEARTVTVKQ